MTGLVTGTPREPYPERPQCLHERTELRRKPNSRGVYSHVWQCLDCGFPQGWTKKANLVNPEELNLWDESLRIKYYEHWQAVGDAWRQRQADLQDDEKRQWRAAYTAYLQTPEWFAKRQAVFERTNGLCEGCRRKPAVHAHHLTYERLGDELLFDLVAVCRACHQKAHPNKTI